MPLGMNGPPLHVIRLPATRGSWWFFHQVLGAQLERGDEDAIVGELEVLILIPQTGGEQRSDRTQRPSSASSEVRSLAS